MKFPITEEQAKQLDEIASKQNAASSTLYVAIQRHEDVVEELTELSDKIWDDIKEEHKLLDTLKWKITVHDGLPYVESLEEE